MADNKKSTKHQEELIQSLTRDILHRAKPLIDPDTDEKELKEVAREISERLNFEANVALNEIVTRFASAPDSERASEPKERLFQRFGINFRAQHMLMMISTIILIITGMPLKFPELGLSKFIIIDLCGGLENSTFIHRVGAVGLIIVSVWHLIFTIFTKVGWRDFMLMIPRPQDIKDAFQTIMYFIGRRSSGPKFGRFSFIEKFDYWAVYWGMVIMICSGLILWFKQFFPKLVYDIGREAHSDEGLLATLAIVVWHFYNVHFNPEVFPMSWVWWHGNQTETEMKHHHALEYAEIIKAERKEIEDRVEQANSLVEAEGE